MTDRRRASGQQDRPSEENNPFAPPPEDAPNRPWRPRDPSGADEPGSAGDDGEQDSQRSRWGSQWSWRQPKRQGGDFGAPPGGPQGEGGTGRPANRWDPSDPAQRHARYAVLSGMWGVFTALLGWDWLALLLGALALYWGVSALRGGPKPSPEDEEAGEAERQRRRVQQLEGGRDGDVSPAPTGGGDGERAAKGGRGAKGRGRRPQFAAAVAGVVLASASLLIVGTTYAMQLVYKDYYDCVEDALTIPARESCEDLLPDQLKPLLGEGD